MLDGWENALTMSCGWHLKPMVKRFHYKIFSTHHKVKPSVWIHRGRREQTCLCKSARKGVSLYVYWRYPVYTYLNWTSGNNVHVRVHRNKWLGGILRFASPETSKPQRGSRKLQNMYLGSGLLIEWRRQFRQHSFYQNSHILNSLLIVTNVVIKTFWLRHNN